MPKLRTRFSLRVLLILGCAGCAATIVFWIWQARTRSVLAELIRPQRESGLTFAWTDKGVVKAISFDTRTVVGLKDSLQAFRPDRFNVEGYPEILDIGMCWSQDQTKLASTMINRSTHTVRLGVLDLKSNQIHDIANNVEQRPYVTSQCWSRDGQELVYEIDGSVRLYGVENHRSHPIARGTDPTWSPDGAWIAFRVGATYYAIHPEGEGRKELFSNYWGKAVSALYWSPDSRIVAYVRQLGFLQGGGPDAEVQELRARRLEDGSEDRLCSDVSWYADYHWLTNSELMNRSDKKAPRTK
jgi:hypothetical protein